MSINSFENYFLSWAPDRNKLSRPCYLAIANLLEEDISTGKLAPGTQLPPQRELADYLGINFTTVTRAYNLCRERNLIYGVTGRGSFVNPLPGTAVHENNADGIELGIVNGFDFLHRPVIEAAENVLGKGYIEKLYSYAENAGHIHQRAAGVRWMEQMGVETDVNHTAVFSGAQNVISAALLSLFKLGDRIATDQYTYANLTGTARLAHLPLVPVPGDGDGMLPCELERVCSRQKISGIFLMPDCANPTTITIPEKRRRELADIIQKYSLTIVEDDHYGALRCCRNTPFYSLLPDNTVYICGSTMSLCSGLRVTYAAFPEKFKEKLLGGLYHLSIKASALEAEIMTELIMSGKAEYIIREKRLLAADANRIYDQIFPGEADPGKENFFFRCLPLPENKMDSRQIEKLFAREGVSVYHSGRFAVGKSSGKSFLRVSVSSAGSAELLKCGLERVKKVIGAM